MSECQIASPSPRPPIGTPSSLTLEITFISGCRGRKGLPYGFGPGGSSLPNCRLNSSICGSVSFWPRNRITRLSSQALRMAANVSAGTGLDASTPLTSAPSASPIFFMWIADMDFPVKGKFYLHNSGTLNLHESQLADLVFVRGTRRYWWVGLKALLEFREHP